MNKNIYLILSALLPLCACAPFPPGPPLTPQACQTSSNIIIHPRSAGIDVSPSNRCAEKGETITVLIVPGNRPKNSVHTIAKSGNPDNPGPGNWLTQSNKEFQQKFTLTVPNTEEFKTDSYYYSVKVDGLGEVDPMVTVER